MDKVALKRGIEQYVYKGIQMVHNPKVADSILAMISPKDPVNSIAKAVVMVVQRIDAAARNAGEEVPDAVRGGGAMAILAQIIEMATVSKKIPKLDEKQQGMIMATAVKMYIDAESAAGRIDKAKLYAAMQQQIAKTKPQNKAKLAQAMSMFSQPEKVEQQGESK